MRLLKRAHQSFIDYAFPTKDASWSLPIVRIGLALAVLLSIHRVIPKGVGHFFEAHRATTYEPIGILAFLGPQLPSRMLFEVCAILAVCSTICVLVGLFTRFNMLVSLVTAMMFSCLNNSFTQSWSVANVFVFLVFIAFILAPAGDRLSVDSALRRRLGRTSKPPGRCFWPILLAQWAIAIGLLNAAYWKCFGRLAVEDWGRWVFSDNLRNQIVQGHELLQFQKDVPWHLQWVVNNEIAWKAVAVGHMLGQSVPTLACLFYSRPWVRGLAGAFFCLEAVGLGVTMNLWDGLRWLPLAAVFVDWDALAVRLRGRSTLASGTTPADFDHEQASARRGANPFSQAFFLTFVGFYTGVAFFGPPGFYWRVLNCYPFRQSDMHCNIMARKPYDKHLPYYLLGTEFSVSANSASQAQRTEIEQDLRRNFFYMGHQIDYELIRDHLQSVAEHVASRYPIDGMEVGVSRAVFVLPAYPKPAGVEVWQQGLMGVIRPDTTFRMVYAHVQCGMDPFEQEIRVRQSGYRDPVYRFGFVLDWESQPRMLDVKPVDDGRFSFFPPVTGRYLMVVYVRESDSEAEEVYFCHFPYVTAPP